VPADDLSAAAGPLISQLGGLFYFEAEATAKADELGLSPFQFYLLGRAGVFGDADASVVCSALGYFNPELIGRRWNAAKAILPPRDGVRAYLDCCAAFGRRYLAGLPGLPAFCVAAEAVRDAANPVGLPLFAGIAAEPLAPDTPGRAMQLVTVLREFRGGAHLLAVVTCGLDAKTAHYLSRPDVFFNFGWERDDVPVATDEDRARLRRANEMTEQLMAPAFGVLDQDGTDALLHGLRIMRKAIPDPA
jgi:helix-turn-helix protein